MVVEFPDYNFKAGLAVWALVMIGAIIAGVLVGLASAIAAYGPARGPRMVATLIGRALPDLFLVSWKRIYAVALLTFKESHRRRAFWILAIFIALFMFGGWFLGTSDSEYPARPYVGFVMTAMNFLLIVMALLIACWGIPADIKARSLHTVVTKPVRRSEIVVGRIVGYIAVLSVVLVATSLVGYFWISSQVPARSQAQLISRVVQYGEMSFKDRNGDPAAHGINVGDMWGYREFVEGDTKSSAQWKFTNLDVAALRKQNELRLEQTFEAFRTYKGDVNKQVRYNLAFINPKTGLRVPWKSFPVNERKAETGGNEIAGVITESQDAQVRVPAELAYRDSYTAESEPKTAKLFDDLIADNSLIVEVSAVDPQQYIGTARRDLFLRLADRSFMVAYFKACFGLWSLLVLLVILGTTASCFLKGPVATMFTATLIFVGFQFRDTIQQTVVNFVKNVKVEGGGPFESMYRIVTRANISSPLPESIGSSIIAFLDKVVFSIYGVIVTLIPDVKYFQLADYPANGFDVPLVNGLLPCVVIVLGFLIPYVVLGYFSLQLRELEHK